MATRQDKKIKAKNALAKVHEKNISAFFQQQKAIVLRALTRRTLSSISRKREGRELASPEAIWSMTTSEWDALWQNVLNQTTPELKKVIASAEADGLHAGADNFKLAIVGIDPSKKPGTTFNLANPRAVQWFQQNGGSVDYIKGIQATTGDSLKRVITTALDEGWSYNTTAKEIQKLYDGPISRDRARRIAVYETGQSYEAGNRIFAESLVDDGVEMEEMWMTSHDEKVRPEHAANEAEGWVEMGHVFSSGDTEPPTDPGCRCYMIYREKPRGD